LPKKEEAKRSHHSEPYNAPTHAGTVIVLKTLTTNLIFV